MQTQQRALDPVGAIHALFEEEHLVKGAVRALQREGFASSHLKVLADCPFPEATAKESKAPEGAVAGVAAGSVAGATLGWLWGVGTFALPGNTWVSVGGPLLALLAGAGLGATLGAIVGTVIGLALSEARREKFDNAVRPGGYLLSVVDESAERIDRAQAILLTCGAARLMGDLRRPRWSENEGYPSPVPGERLAG